MTTADIWKIVEDLRKKSPLVQSITNFVAMQITANALLSAGASPLMSHAPEEQEDISRIINALVLNMGTLDTAQVAVMHLAGECAKKNGVPVLFDPVGAGASAFRTATALDILQHVSPQIVRGNASEIMALAGAHYCSRGVDSVHSTSDAKEAAISIAKEYSCVVTISGAEDFVTDGKNGMILRGGCALMPKVTAMGCSASVVVAAYAAVAPSYYEACIAGMAVMSTAGSMAGALHTAPGSFAVAFLDALYTMSYVDMEKSITLLPQ